MCCTSMTSRWCRQRWRQRGRALPVVADMHENYPATVVAWRSDQPWYRPVLVWLRAIHRFHENRCSRRCARIIVTGPEAGERFVRRGVPATRLVVVSNTEDETTMPWPLPGIDAAMAAEFAGKWVAVFVGGNRSASGLDTAIRGVGAIVEAVPGFLLLIVGAKNSQAERLRSLAQRCRVEKHVDIRGWEPFERCIQYDLIAQVGLVPFRDTEHTQTVVPHKLFQYMMCGRPVVVSDCAPLNELSKRPSPEKCLGRTTRRILPGRSFALPAMPNGVVDTGQTARKPHSADMLGDTTQPDWWPCTPS